MIKFKTITQTEFKKLRYKQWQKQKRICPILKQILCFEDAVFDHKHRTKAEELGKDGKGLLRGVIHRNANVIEGKIVRLYKRYGLSKYILLPELLRNIADYIEKPPMKPKYIHPDEREFVKIGKRDYNLICKYYFQMFPRRVRLPIYPKSGKMTKKFDGLLKVAKKLHLKKG